VHGEWLVMWCGKQEIGANGRFGGSDALWMVDSLNNLNWCGQCGSMMSGDGGT